MDDSQNLSLVVMALFPGCDVYLVMGTIILTSSPPPYNPLHEKVFYVHQPKNKQNVCIYIYTRSHLPYTAIQILNFPESLIILQFI